MIDLSLVTPPNIIEAISFEDILAERKARLIELTQPEYREQIARTLELESEPLLILLQENAYRELYLRQRINEGCWAVMLAYAKQGDLDQLAANEGLERLIQQEGDSTAIPPIPRLMESDERLRFRTQLSREATTTAGPRGMYLFHALSASARVADASVMGPEMIFTDAVPHSNGIPPGNVWVYLLSTDNNGVADPALVATVLDYLNDETRRPLTDTVVVWPGEIVEYRITAALYIYPGPSEAPILNAARENAKAFVADQFKLGHDIRLSALYAQLHVSGVQRVELSSPADDIVIADSQAARCTGITITLAGRDV